MSVPVLEALFRFYQDSPTLASADSGASDFARMLIFREFGKTTGKSHQQRNTGTHGCVLPALGQVSGLPKN